MNFESYIEIESFSSFLNPDLFIVPDAELLSFPPFLPDTLPLIAEEELTLSDLLPLEDNNSLCSI